MKALLSSLIALLIIAVGTSCGDQDKQGPQIEMPKTLLGALNSIQGVLDEAQGAATRGSIIMARIKSASTTGSMTAQQLYVVEVCRKQAANLNSSISRLAKCANRKDVTGAWEASKDVSANTKLVNDSLDRLDQAMGWN